MDTKTDDLNAVEINPAAEARHSVIWLHGLGADGHDFEPLVPELRLPDVLAVRFVFPHAPVRPVSLNGGYPMRAWFDVTSLDRSTRIDLDGLHESEQRVHDLIRRENERGVPTDRIVLAGFSQGGAVALHTAPRYPERLAGLIALSTFSLTNRALAAEAAPANRDLPVFMAHGTLDPVVAPDLGHDSRDALTDAGFKVDWHDYEMQHAVCPEEVGDLRGWLLDILR
ncbi:MAG TPA: dienelactone hydrolase family protein [Gammaproteobacteria bacterium]|nr:dienelactone hydrolase family protein [Gammaproteobacteria bacterium]HET7587970.1 dienelactone hydrolase family protein [Gammaproteobacteria bacterium]